MFLPSRSRGGSTRFLYTRVGLFFLSAGVWLAGVVIEDERFTGAAIFILLIALVLGLIGRRRDEGRSDPADPIDPDAEETS